MRTRKKKNKILDIIKKEKYFYFTLPAEHKEKILDFFSELGIKVMIPVSEVHIDFIKEKSASFIVVCEKMIDEEIYKIFEELHFNILPNVDILLNTMDDDLVKEAEEHYPFKCPKTKVPKSLTLQK